jgi:hypothetical protein
MLSNPSVNPDDFKGVIAGRHLYTVRLIQKGSSSDHTSEIIAAVDAVCLQLCIFLW